MDIKNSEKTQKSAAQAPASSRELPASDPDLPVYYDSEPSSQPPQYNEADNRASVKTQTATRPQAHHAGSGAPASTVAALLASPEPESEQKKSLRERWKDWKERNLHGDGLDDQKWDVHGSSAQWNVLGASVNGSDRAKSRRLR